MRAMPSAMPWPPSAPCCGRPIRCCRGASRRCRPASSPGSARRQPCFRCVCHLVLEQTVLPDGAGQWLAVLGLGLMPVGAAFYAWDIGVKRGNIQVLGAASYAAPLLSTLVLIAAGVAEPSLRILAACVLITGGAALAAKSLFLRKPRASGPGHPKAEPGHDDAVCRRHRRQRQCDADIFAGGGGDLRLHARTCRRRSPARRQRRWRSRCLPCWRRCRAARCCWSRRWRSAPSATPSCRATAKRLFSAGWPAFSSPTSSISCCSCAAVAGWHCLAPNPGAGRSRSPWRCSRSSCWRRSGAASALACGSRSPSMSWRSWRWACRR